MKNFKTNKTDKIDNYIYNLLEKIKTNKYKYEHFTSSLKGFFNITTRKTYNGENLILMMLDLMFTGRSQAYLTFNQAKKEHLKIKKGSASLPIKFYSKVETKEEEEKKKYFIKWFSVFNIEDIENTEEKEKLLENFGVEKEITAKFKIDKFLKLNKGKVPQIIRVDKEAYFDPKKNIIALPKTIKEGQQGNATKIFFHELAHSTELNLRYNAENKNNYSYAVEEIIAETFAYLKCIQNGESSNKNSFAYIQGWERAAKEVQPSIIIHEVRKIINCFTW